MHRDSKFGFEHSAAHTTDECVVFYVDLSLFRMFFSHFFIFVFVLHIWSFALFLPLTFSLHLTLLCLSCMQCVCIAFHHTHSVLRCYVGQILLFCYYYYCYYYFEIPVFWSYVLPIYLFLYIGPLIVSGFVFFFDIFLNHLMCIDFVFRHQSILLMVSELA